VSRSDEIGPWYVDHAEEIKQVLRDAESALANWSNLTAAQKDVVLRRLVRVVSLLIRAQLALLNDSI
jgi:hypothetical protein